ncbi:MAG: DNA polymerase, partial [Gammaproteobacteria bacterium]|nr:DNA polymerase [Gammaproteobacteria bacterium]
MRETKLKWLFLDMNSFFASVEQQLRPELRAQPVGVVPVMADSSCCIAASYEAKGHGIKTGTRVSEAKERCPGIRLVQARPAEYIKVHEAIVSAVDSVLPVHKVHSIDEMACKLTGSQCHEDSAIALGRQAKRAIQQQVGDQLKSSVGIASNRFLAKIASNLQKPDGLSMITADDLPEVLYSMALDDLTGIGKGMLKRLNAQGIQTVEQLYGLSSERLRKVWGGIAGEWWWYALRGHDLPEPESKRRTVGHSHVLSPEFRTQQGARAVMVKLIHKAAARLRKLGYYSGEISIVLRYPRQDGWQVKQVMEPCQDTQSLLAIFDGLWKQRPTTMAPLSVGVTLSKLVPESSMSLSLFPE